MHGLGHHGRAFRRPVCGADASAVEFGDGPRWGRGGGGPGGGGDWFKRRAHAGAAATWQLIALALIAEQPRHGYEIIKLLEDKSDGAYSPSPGMG